MGKAPLDKAIQSPLPCEDSGTSLRTPSRSWSARKPLIPRRDLAWWAILIGASVIVFYAASVKVHVQFPQGLHRSRRIIARNSKLLDQLEAHLNECGDSCEVQDLISIARRQIAEDQVLMARLQRTIDSHEEFAAENIKVSRSLQTCQEDLHKNAQLQHGIERDLMGLKQKLSSFQSRDEACWQSLKRSQDLARYWQKLCCAVTGLCILLATSIVSGYRRWFHRKLWVLTSERARLSAALKLAETGLRQRVRQAKPE